MRNLLLFGFLGATLLSVNAQADNINYYNQSISLQAGINGILENSNSFGLQLIPPDISYSRELFDDDNVNISTATFYDNIGVKITDNNFSYRFGQRMDFGVELEKYTP